MTLLLRASTWHWHPQAPCGACSMCLAMQSGRWRWCLRRCSAARRRWASPQTQASQGREDGGQRQREAAADSCGTGAACPSLLSLASDSACCHPGLAVLCCAVLCCAVLCCAGVDARLYKLLLYEPGSHFKPHRDSEKAAGMFATLTIMLPSSYQVRCPQAALSRLQLPSSAQLVPLCGAVLPVPPPLCLCPFTSPALHCTASPPLPCSHLYAPLHHLHRRVGSWW